MMPALINGNVVPRRDRGGKDEERGEGPIWNKSTPAPPARRQHGIRSPTGRRHEHAVEDDREQPDAELAMA